jgi:predicted XRE-type DNA-binding protein
VRTIEQQLLNEIEKVMEAKGLKQTDYAKAMGISRQSVNDYFKGRRGLLTDTGKDLLEYLGVEIRLVPKGGNNA